MVTDARNVAIVGASGYTGGELCRLLSGHPRVSISVVASSEKTAGQSLSDIFPHLTSAITLNLETLDPEAIAQKADIIFLALPHTKSLHPAATFLELGKLVIDLSADFRLKKPAVYEHWYDTPHPFPALLNEAAYGLPEVHRIAIQRAKLIAVPGCYPTAAILQLAPLLAHDLIDLPTVIIDAKSGVSGAGRGPALAYHFPEAHESVHAYKIGAHRHLPEIEQELNGIIASTSRKEPSASTPDSITFVPHLVPLNRGILSTAYARVKPHRPDIDWKALYEDYYKDYSFIRMFPDPQHVSPNHVRGSNFCDMCITYEKKTGLIIVVAALDNLVKGAAGQAIQCMNVALGFPEDLGLSAPGVFP